MPSCRTDYDLIVVGAGPAGSAAAIAARRARPSARVLLIDRAPLGRDKVCGDGIAPHAVAELEALGVTGVLPHEIVATVRLSAPGGDSNAAVTAEPGYVVPRATFDERLARAAIGAGAEFAQHKVTNVRQGPDAVEVDGTWRAPLLIAADGSNSIVRRRAGQRANIGDAMAVAIRGYVPTPARARDELVASFSEPGGPSVLVISIRAGGRGLNLPAANHVFHFDRWWNPAVEQQATDRAYRFGQHKDVFVHSLICTATLEERIDELLDSKRELAEKVVAGRADDWLGELNLDAIRAAVALSPSAIEEAA